MWQGWGGGCNVGKDESMMWERIGMTDLINCKVKEGQ